MVLQDSCLRDLQALKYLIKPETFPQPSPSVLETIASVTANVQARQRQQQELERLQTDYQKLQQDHVKMQQDHLKLQQDYEKLQLEHQHHKHKRQQEEHFVHQQRGKHQQGLQQKDKQTELEQHRSQKQNKLEVSKETSCENEIQQTGCAPNKFTKRPLEQDQSVQQHQQRPETTSATQMTDDEEHASVASAASTASTTTATTCLSGEAFPDTPTVDVASAIIEVSSRPKEQMEPLCLKPQNEEFLFEGEHKEYLKRLASAETEAKLLRRDYQKLLETNQEQHHAVAAAKMELETAREDVRLASATMVNQQQRIEELESIVKHQQQIATACRADYEVLVVSHEKLQQDLVTSENRLREFEERSSVAFSTIERQQEKIRELDEQLHQSTEVREKALREQVQRLEKELADLRAVDGRGHQTESTTEEEEKMELVSDDKVRLESHTTALQQELEDVLKSHENKIQSLEKALEEVKQEQQQGLNMKRRRTKSSRSSSLKLVPSPAKQNVGGKKPGSPTRRKAPSTKSVDRMVQTPPRQGSVGSSPKRRSVFERSPEYMSRRNRWLRSCMKKPALVLKNQESNVLSSVATAVSATATSPNSNLDPMAEHLSAAHSPKCNLPPRRFKRRRLSPPVLDPSTPTSMPDDPDSPIPRVKTPSADFQNGVPSQLLFVSQMVSPDGGP